LVIPLVLIWGGWARGPMEWNASEDLAPVWPMTSWLVYHGALIAIFLVFSAACIFQGDRAEAAFLVKDPSEVVADETAGQCIPLMFLPPMVFQFPGVAIFTVFFAFLCFRVFDIVKPWPARQLQRIPGGWGILIDDLFAGLYAAAMVQLLTRVML